MRDRRLALHISKEALAHLANIDRRHVCKIELREGNVTLLNLLEFAHVISRRPSELLGAAVL
ncbi:helix-turn-helix transcriptional regulator [Paraburkholderia sp. Se-20369]|nr:helix-turn-helix transcriptional regulator [Paraburkholderia sp. Se-20369]